MMRRASATSLHLMGREQEPKRRLFAFDGIDLAADDQRHADGFRQAAGVAVAVGPQDLDLAERDRQLGLARGTARARRQAPPSSRRPRPRRRSCENKRRPVGQTAILSRPHQLFHCGRLERETFVDVALAIFDHRGAGRAGFSQGAGGLRALEPAAAVLLLKRPLLALVAFAAWRVRKKLSTRPSTVPALASTAITG